MNEDFYPVGSGLKAALCRRVGRAMQVVEVTGEILLSPGKDLAPYLKAVRRWMWLRKRLENLVMEEDFTVWEHPPTLVPIELGTGEGWALEAWERRVA